MFDIDKIRTDFPILNQEIHGNPLVYLDNAASAQKPKAVIYAITQCYEKEYSNVHRGLHYLSNQATSSFEEARRIIKKFLNASSENEVIFTHNATEAINLVANGMGINFINEGDEIIISILEHHSNIIPWHFLRERIGAKLNWVGCNENGELDFDEFSSFINDKTKIVAITQMSNVTGTMPPLKKIIELAHSYDVPVLVDGSQGAVHSSIDVQELDCDFYICTGHKLYGPSGIGVLYGKENWLDRLPPYQGGGEMIVEVNKDNITYADLPHKFEAGTPPIAQAIGLGAALNYIESIGKDAIAAHEHDLLIYANNKLSEIDGLRIFGNSADKGGIISFALADIHAHDIAALVDRYGVAIRAGTHCAQPLLKYFGVTSTCRASLALYNNFNDVDIFIDSLNKCSEFFK